MTCAADASAEDVRAALIALLDALKTAGLMVAERVRRLGISISSRERRTNNREDDYNVNGGDEMAAKVVSLETARAAKRSGTYESKVYYRLNGKLTRSQRRL